MQLEQDKYYHLYNRTNNREKLFKEPKNYLYFLSKFRKRFTQPLTTFAYCLMPTHFHFLVRIDAPETKKLNKQIGIFLGAYTKAINNAYERNGSLFQEHTKAIIIDDHSYLITLLTYIHQNPVRAKLVQSLTEWPYSSYPDLAGFRNGTLVDKTLVNKNFTSVQAFRAFSNNSIKGVKSIYWVDP